MYYCHTILIKILQSVRKIYTWFVFSLLLFNSVFAGEIVLVGKYFGKNIYVENKFAGSGVGFCIYEVRVNGNVTTDEWNSSAFMIELDQLNIAYGSDVKIQIFHKDDCKPRVLNADVLSSTPTFQTLEFKVTDKGLLTFVTKGENGPIPFKIEHFKWNKWVEVGEIIGRGTPEKNTYTANVFLVSGENKFRIKQISNGKKLYSPETKVLAFIPKVTMTFEKGKDKVTFSGPTQYEVFDSYGQLKLKGNGTSFDFGKLPKGSYFVNYDNTYGEVKR